MMHPRAALAAAALLGVAAPAVLAQTAPPAIQGLAQRTEVYTYDNWRVTCVDTPSAKNKRACSAELNILAAAQQGAQPQVVFSWVIGRNDNGLATAMYVPTGVLIGPGVEIKFGKAALRKEAFTACLPNRCEATFPLTEALIKDIASAETSEASVQAIDGRKLQFTINSKGFDKALAEVRK